MKWAMSNFDKAQAIAANAYQEVKDKHTIKNRVNQILEVCS